MSFMINGCERHFYVSSPKSSEPGKALAINNKSGKKMERKFQGKKKGEIMYQEVQSEEKTVAENPRIVNVHLTFETRNEERMICSIDKKLLTEMQVRQRMALSDR